MLLQEGDVETQEASEACEGSTPKGFHHQRASTSTSPKHATDVGGIGIEVFELVHNPCSMMCVCVCVCVCVCDTVY